MNLLEQAARAFAEEAHRSIDQRRKYTNEPYIVHPQEVVELVRQVTHTPEMLAAAWLHDTREDVPHVTHEVILSKFGPVVAEYVNWLTDEAPKNGESLNRQARKELDRLRLYRAPAEVQTIKLADLLSNTRSIVQYDRKFAQTYVAEKAMLLCVLRRGDPLLLGKAFALLIDAADELHLDIFSHTSRA